MVCSEGMDLCSKCWKEEGHHGEGGMVILDQGGGGRVHIGPAKCGPLPDVAGELN